MDQQKEPSEASTFRAEALAHRARSRGPGGLVKLSPRWANWAFVVIIAVFACALTAASLVNLDRYVPGVVAKEDRRVVVLVPAAQVPSVPTGNPVEIGRRRTEVTHFDGQVLYPPEIRERFKINLSTPSVVVMTSARPKGAGGEARVLVESEPLIVALVPGLKALFGGGDG